jgi:uncharacterized membrane protein YdbT with pleckstrin-like domain
MKLGDFIIEMFFNAITLCALVMGGLFVWWFQLFLGFSPIWSALLVFVFMIFEVAHIIVPRPGASS